VDKSKNSIFDQTKTEERKLNNLSDKGRKNRQITIILRENCSRTEREKEENFLHLKEKNHQKVAFKMMKKKRETHINDKLGKFFVVLYNNPRIKRRN
jgi:hypothetical protein